MRPADRGGAPRPGQRPGASEGRPGPRPGAPKPSMMPGQARPPSAPGRPGTPAGGPPRGRGGRGRGGAAGAFGQRELEVQGAQVEAREAPGDGAGGAPVRSAAPPAFRSGDGAHRHPPAPRFLPVRFRREDQRRTPAALVTVLLKFGEMANANQSLDEETFAVLGEELGYRIEIVSPEDEGQGAPGVLRHRPGRRGGGRDRR